MCPKKYNKKNVKIYNGVFILIIWNKNQLGDQKDIPNKSNHHNKSELKEHSSNTA